MTYLALSTRTAPTARSHIPLAAPLPAATLSASRSAAALASWQGREHMLIDATTSSLTCHLEAVASFADRVVALDASLGDALGGSLGGSL